MHQDSSGVSHYDLHKQFKDGEDGVSMEANLIHIKQYRNKRALGTQNQEKFFFLIEKCHLYHLTNFCLKILTCLEVYLYIKQLLSFYILYQK